MKSSINENIQTASAAPRLVVYTNQSETHLTAGWAHSVIGLSSGPMAFVEIEEIRNLGDEERRKKAAGLPFAKEALELIAESLDSKLALPMGHYLVNDTGSPEELWMLILHAVEVLQCCDRCMEQVETGVAELRACKFVCKQCTTDHQLYM